MQFLSHVFLANVALWDRNTIGHSPVSAQPMPDKASKPMRSSPSQLQQIWDTQTLASFSVSQLDAFSALYWGDCPYLSRAIRCGRHRRGEMGTVSFSRLQRLVSAYLDEEAALAQRQAVSMMRHVWTNYEERAFGKDELRPVSGIGRNNWGGIGQTLVDALDTLWLMDFKEEFDRAALWVEQSLSFSKDLNVNLFETSIRHLGGLLSAFALSRRSGLLDVAKDLGDRLIKAFPPPRTANRSRDTSKGLGAEFKKLLHHVGLPTEALDSVLGNGKNSEVVISLPSSDINLGSGETKNLAGFISLAEAYVPIEWKYLAALTTNCSYSAAQDQVLHAINRSLNLEENGLGMIMLKQDGKAFPSAQNRLSLGSRGDSFYEYLLKDLIFSADVAEDKLTKKLWSSFRAKLPGLFAEGHQVDRTPGSSWPHRSPKEVPRGRGGALGGWHESWKDAPSPWLFLKEITPHHTVPKMDHLVCFLPGAIALEIFHSEKKSEVDLQLAHRLAQTCVHMYWRTVSDLAPEITRFTQNGLVDDKGSMHNILRPETIESLFLLWRTSKKQIYRNWGQRMLAAFYRTKTRFGFASLHNVNQPSKRRDDMPSFFVAETLKYLFLLFSPDTGLPLDQYVLSTEAHPVPILGKAHSGLKWPCHPKQTSQAKAEKPEDPKDGDQATKESTPKSTQVCDPQRVQQLEEQMKEGERQLQKIRREYGMCVSDPICWASGYTYEDCCFPVPVGNTACWDAEFTYSRCCG